ncbi:MAG: chemotaxis protein CheR [Undibacterium sp.]|nr:chemotaxis protein CheR [Undibacterium sp.]
MTKHSGRSEGDKEFLFSDRDFDRVRDLIYRRAGISLSDSKQEMVYSRLARRLRAVGLNSFATYLDLLESESESDEWEAFTNSLTTNLTSFFREGHHFPILAEHICKKQGQVRIWCSASSTGEEPYSIAIAVCEAFGTLKPNVQIVATDIDTNVLATAARGVYNIDRIEKMSPDRVRKYFLRGKGKNEGSVLVRPELRALIHFERLNLLDDRWAIQPEFDVIFCRNVMIYFDKPTQAGILKKFVPLLKDDGLLFAGHSENFLYVSDDFELRGKTVYALANQENKRKNLDTRALHRG